MNKKLLTIWFLYAITLSFAFGQDTTSQAIAHADTIFPEFRCGPPIAAGLVIGEAILIGFSYYAAKPQAYGDKVMGGIYAGSSVATVVYLPFYWFGKANRKDPGFKKDRIWTSIMLAGMGYGFSRLALYNLLQAEGDNSSQRFARNIIEVNTAYIVPITLGILIRNLMNKQQSLPK